jgi:hypothetical protein
VPAVCRALGWGFLVQKLRHKGGMTAAALSRAAGLSRQYGVGPALARLMQRGLVVHKGKLWYAVKPPDQLQGRFIDKGQSGQWYDRLAYFKVCLPREGVLTTRQAALLGVLASRNIKAAAQTAKGLAALLRCDPRTAAKALRALCQLGLMTMNGHKIVGVTADPALFQSKKVKADGQAATVTQWQVTPRRKPQAARRRCARKSPWRPRARHSAFRTAWPRGRRRRGRSRKPSPWSSRCAWGSTRP